MAVCNRGVCQLLDGIADTDVITVVFCCEFVHAGVVLGPTADGAQLREYASGIEKKEEEWGSA